MSKDQLNRLIGIAISTLIAVLAVFGYDILVVRPMFHTLGVV